MSDRDELQDFSLDDILREFGDEEPTPPAPEEPSSQEPIPENENAPTPQLSEEAFSRVMEEPSIEDDAQSTVRLDDLSGVTPPVHQEAPPQKSVILELDPKARLRELKKKLIAGPEKRYYELAELGLGKLQTAVFLNLLLVLLCALTTALYTTGIVPQTRLRLVIFVQVLSMLLSALLGSHQMTDGLGELLRGRFSVNTLLALTFAACCVDAVFCLRDLRVPCCGAFSLEMALALLARYHRRSTEMARMDTLRKAVRLHALGKAPDLYEGRPGYLRGYGRLEDFWEHYQKTSGPEKFQCVYAFVSFLLCLAIAVFTYLRHGASMAFQILATSLLVAVPAGYFVALTRPAAILEKRLHMVGTVLCGWQGVRGTKGKGVFPLKDEDLFPQGSTKLNGVKFYGSRSPEEIVSYATSVICASGSGLAYVFRQLLASRGGRELPVTNFRNYGDGGVGGEVCQESVLLGSYSFLRDMGVEVPEGSAVTQAVYVAIDGSLCAVVAISYAKMRSSSAGLVSLCANRKLSCILTGGDFMLTAELLRDRFGINPRRVVFPAPELRAQLRERTLDEGATALALSTRDDLISYAYALSGARALRRSCVLGTVIHVLGGVLGLLIMALLSYLGSAELLTPTNVLLYQLVWLVPGLLATEWTRTV